MMTNEHKFPAVDNTVDSMAIQLERWGLFRSEMQNHQNKLAKLAISFIELNAFEDAAKCAIQAEGIKYVLARMPNFYV